MTIYLVTANGYYGAYGAEIYAIGAYPTAEEAHKVAQNYMEAFNEWTMVTELELGKTYEMHVDENAWKCYTNGKHLGGYIE